MLSFVFYMMCGGVPVEDAVWGEGEISLGRV